MKILIPLDGTELSESALERARPLAEATGAEVHLLRVYRPPRGSVFSAEATDEWRARAVASHEFGFEAPPMPPPIETYDQAVARMELAGDEYLRERAKAFSPLAVTRKVLVSKDAAQAIISYASENGVDLIALASRGRVGLARLLAAGVPARVAAARAAPVLVVAPRKKGPVLEALIFNEAGTTIVEQCRGPDPAGRCPRAGLEGLVACAARRIMTLTSAGIVGGMLQVAPRERSCPLAALAVPDF